jgi:hypothetical protein
LIAALRGWNTIRNMRETLTRTLNGTNCDTPQDRMRSDYLPCMLARVARRVAMKRRPAVQLITVHEHEIEREERAAASAAIAQAARVLHDGGVLQLRIAPGGAAKPVALERDRPRARAGRVRRDPAGHGRPQRPARRDLHRGR